MACFRLVLIVFFLQTAAAARAADPQILFTADTEGHLGPCRECPMHAGDGGLARRATVLKDRRSADSLSLDAGNALFGEESLDSDGRSIIAAYNQLKYDVVNLAASDFRLGAAKTQALLKDARFDAVSASLLDDSTGRPMFKPYVVKQLGGKRIAILGLTELPAPLEMLPHLKRQLAHIRIEPAPQALGEWLPKARAESDRVIVLYYGPPTGLRAIRDKFGTQLAAIVVGGMRPDELPAGAAPLIAATDEHGKAIGQLTLTGDAGWKLTQLAVTPAAAADPAMQEMLARYTAPATTNPPPAVPAPKPAEQTASSGSGGQTQQQQQPAQRSPFGGLGGGLLSKDGEASPPPAAATVPSQSPKVAMTPPPPPAASAAPPAARAAPVVKRVPAHQSLQPRGLAGVGLTAEQVNAAIDRGGAFLWNYIQTEDMQKHNRRFGDEREHILAALALVHCGLHRKTPEFDRDLRAYLTRVDPYAMGTYEDALLCMLIEAYGDPVFYEKQRQAARMLLEGQGAKGSWSYGIGMAPVATNMQTGPALRVLGGGPGGGAEPMGRLTEWTKGMDGDNSCSQFALLGLQAASHCGTAVAPVLWQRSLDAFRARESQASGWAYHEPAPPYGSMTCAGICSLTIDLYHLGRPHPEQDEAVERGVGWLDAHFSVTDNPERGSYLYYYLYSLERVGQILDTEFIGSHEWYPLGARYLVDNQKPDGSWIDPTDKDPRLGTGFALLFLTRATPKLALEVKHGGPGTLKADIESPPPSRLYIILDASGSMIDEMEGKPKFDAARGAVAGLVAALPDATQVALRVYGHRKRSIEPGSDEDTALEIPMATLDRARFAARLQSLRARGKTPLALSLTQATSDLGGVSPANPATLLLLTDGGEDTVPRRDPVKVAAQLAQLKGITFHIVGFDINQQDWGEQLRAMAEASNGHYWPAASPAALPTQLKAAVFGRPEGFTILSADGREIGRGRFGQAISLPEGKYQLKTSYGGAQATVQFAIATDATTAVLFDASRLPAGPTIAPDPSQSPAPTAAPASPIAHRFCTHCGHALPPGAKFCPSCGQKVE